MTCTRPLNGSRRTRLRDQFSVSPVHFYVFHNYYLLLSVNSVKGCLVHALNFGFKLPLFDSRIELYNWCSKIGIKWMSRRIVPTFDHHPVHLLTKICHAQMGCEPFAVQPCQIALYNVNVTAYVCVGLQFETARHHVLASFLHKFAHCINPDQYQIRVTRSCARTHLRRVLHSASSVLEPWVIKR
jgi:hypothetical protein